MNDDESLRVCDNCRGCGQDGDPPDANGEGGWIGACEKCQGRGLLDWGDTDVVGAEILVLRASLTARDEALASIRAFAQDCIENGHDRGSLGNLYSIRDLCDRLAKGETK